MSLLRIDRVSFSALCLLLAACGANVVFGTDGEEGGSGGSGGSGASGGAGGSGASGGSGGQGAGPGPGGSPNTTSVNPETTCQKFCSAWGDCIGDDDCADLCDSIYSPGCEFQAEDLLQCYIANPPVNCEAPEFICQAEGNAYNQCVNSGDCFTDSCEDGGGPGGQGSCACEGFCFGEQFRAECFESIKNGDPPPPPGGVFCDCFMNEEYIGSCDMDFLSCSIEESCCPNLLLND